MRPTRPPDWSKVYLEALGSEIAERIGGVTPTIPRQRWYFHRVAPSFVDAVPKLPAAPSPNTDPRWAEIGRMVLARGMH